MNDAQLPWFLTDTERAINSYISHLNCVCLDYETTILPGWATNPEQHIVLAVWYVIKNGVIRKRYKFADEYNQAELAEDIAAADFVVAHNAKFETQWLARSGVDTHNLLVYCTQVCEWVIAGNRKMNFDLDGVAARRLKDEKDYLGKNLIKKWGVCPSVTPRSWLLKYCTQDVDLTWRIFLQQVEELTKLDLWHIALQRNLAIPVLADIELQGLQLDGDVVLAEYEKTLALRETLGEQLDAITGGINLGSPKQLGTFLYGNLGFASPRDDRGEPIKTPGGDISTANPALIRLKATNKAQARFLELYKEYNKADTLITKTLNYFKGVVEHLGAVFYGTINHGRAATGRLASGSVKVIFTGTKKEVGAQLQNIPREYKRMFTAHDPDYVVMELDGAGQEFRCGVEMSQDKQGILDIDNGEDVHAFTAYTMIVNKDPAFKHWDAENPKDIKAARQLAKPQTFQPMYGGQGNTPAQKAYAAAWREKYPDMFKMQTEWTLIVAEQKKLTTPYGLHFYWPHAIMYNSGYVKHSTEIFNFPIQGFATGEIIPIALIYFWHRTKGMPVELFNTVHDSLIVRARMDVVEDVKMIGKQALTTDVYHFLRTVYNYEWRNVPLGAGVKVSRHWGVAEVEELFEIYPDGRERYTKK